MFTQLHVCLLYVRPIDLVSPAVDPINPEYHETQQGEVFTILVLYSVRG
jgi:hypothetical protein